MNFINGIFKNKVMDVIQCDESDYIIRKWHPNTHSEDQPYTIRWGSSLKVKDHETAAFVHSQYGNVLVDYIEGPCQMLIETENLPVLTSILGFVYNEKTPFIADVYFLNTGRTIDLKFGVPFFDVLDFKTVNNSVPVAVRGDMHYNIEEYEYLIKQQGFNSLTIADFNQQLKPVIARSIKHIVTNIPRSLEISVLQMESMISVISDLIETNLREKLFKEFGINLSSVDLTAVEIDKTSIGYRYLTAESV